MAYATLREQIASRTDGMEDPSLAEKLGYGSPLDRPWTPRNVGSQILAARGNSHGTSSHHPSNPTKFQLAAYTLLDPVPVKVGTQVKYIGQPFYQAHNSRFVFVQTNSSQARYAMEAGAYNGRIVHVGTAYDTPGAPQYFLGDDFAIEDRQGGPSYIYKIGTKELSDLTILDQGEEEILFELVENGQIAATGLAFRYVCTVYNSSLSKGAIYFAAGGKIWCYTTDDCTLGLVRFEDGSILTESAFRLSHSRGTLDDDRFESGQFHLFGGHLFRFDGFRVVHGPITTFGTHTTKLFSNDYIATGGSRDRRLFDMKDEVRYINFAVYENSEAPGQSSGAIDVPVADTLEDFAAAIKVSTIGWTRNGWRGIRNTLLKYA